MKNQIHPFQITKRCAHTRIMFGSSVRHLAKMEHVAGNYGVIIIYYHAPIGKEVLAVGVDSNYSTHLPSPLSSSSSYSLAFHRCMNSPRVSVGPSCSPVCESTVSCRYGLSMKGFSVPRKSQIESSGSPISARQITLFSSFRSAITSSTSFT